MILLTSNSVFRPTDYVMEDLIKPNSKIVAFSGSDLKWQRNNIDELLYDGYYFEEQYKPFREFGIQKEDFYIVTPEDNIEFVEFKVEKSDIIVLLGGYMESLETLLKFYRIWDKFDELQHRKNIIGISAGALVLCDEYYTTPHVDDYYEEYDLVKGIGLVEDMRILVHYDMNNKHHQDNLYYIMSDIIDSNRYEYTEYFAVTLSDTQSVLVDDNGLELFYDFSLI